MFKLATCSLTDVSSSTKRDVVLPPAPAPGVRRLLWYIVLHGWPHLLQLPSAMARGTASDHFRERSLTALEGGTAQL